MKDSKLQNRPFAPIRARVETEQPLSEKQIEQKLVEVVRGKGGRALKFVSPGFAGVPDRIVLLPGGRMAFVELKAPDQKMRPLQMRRKRQLEILGFRVFCIDSTNQIEEILSDIGNGGKAE